MRYNLDLYQSDLVFAALPVFILCKERNSWNSRNSEGRGSELFVLDLIFSNTCSSKKQACPCGGENSERSVLTENCVHERPALLQNLCTGIDVCDTIKCYNIDKDC